MTLKWGQWVASCCKLSDRQTDVTKPVVAFPDFTNAATGDGQKYWKHQTI